MVASRWSSYSCGVTCWQKVNAATKHEEDFMVFMEDAQCSGTSGFFCFVFYCGSGATVFPNTVRYTKKLKYSISIHSELLSHLMVYCVMVSQSVINIELTSK